MQRVGLGAAAQWLPYAMLDFGDLVTGVSCFYARQFLSCSGKQGREKQLFRCSSGDLFLQGRPPQALLAVTWPRRAGCIFRAAPLRMRGKAVRREAVSVL